MDLNHMLSPAKSPEKCGLEMLSQPQDRLVSLFEQKTVKGWWPCVSDSKGEKILAVSRLKNDLKTVKMIRNVTPIHCLAEIVPFLIFGSNTLIAKWFLIDPCDTFTQFACLHFGSKSVRLPKREQEHHKNIKTNHYWQLTVFWCIYNTVHAFFCWEIMKKMCRKHLINSRLFCPFLYSNIWFKYCYSVRL